VKKRRTIYLAGLFFISFVCIYYFYPEGKLKDDQKADKIVINKANHELILYYKEDLIATYKVSLSRKGLGKKTKEGDNLTPEGRFLGKKRPKTEYHKAIGVGKWGECCAVLIHGLGKEFGWTKKFHRWLDLTKGCIALTNDEMDEIYKAVENGVLIEINP
jgi:murein L,D-transpeptidase YafK